MGKADEADEAGDDSDVEEPIIEEVEPEEEAAAAEKDEVHSDEDDEKSANLMEQIEKQKKGKSPAQKLLKAQSFKAQGNTAYKQGEVFDATDAYYSAIYWCKDICLKPEQYPNIGHSAQQQQEAKDLCESLYCNIALMHNKYASFAGRDIPDRNKALEEAIKMAGECLKVNPKNTKAFHRRATSRNLLTKGEPRGQQIVLLTEARKDLMSAAELDPQNRDIRTELKTITDRLKALKKEELANEKNAFGFAATFGAFSAKEKDLLGDGSIKKLLLSEGTAEKWFNEDWLMPDAQTKCVAHVKAKLISYGGEDGKRSAAADESPTALSFCLGDKDINEGMDLAVRSMTPGETARYTLAPRRLQATGGLVKRLPAVDEGATSCWEITFEKYQAWTDLDRNGERLQKIFDEGWGKFPAELSEVTVHWRVLGPDSAVLHSSRNTLSMQGSSMKHVEDDEKEPPTYSIGETCWPPLAMLLRSLRDGGVGELRMKVMPALPQEDTSGDVSNSGKLSQMMNKMSQKRGADDLRHCTVRAELRKVVLPVSGPEDERWDGLTTIVAERFRAQQLLDKGQEGPALVRLRRGIAWGREAPAADAKAALKELALSRATLGWALACRAALVLDSGDGVTSSQLAVANKELAEAKENCGWLEAEAPGLPDTKLLRAKILVAEDDDFKGAHEQLRAAEKLAPDDKRVQGELKKVKAELHKEGMERSKARLVEIRDSLKMARSEVTGRDETVVVLLLELQSMNIPWEAVMETRIGVEIKGCQENCGPEVQQLCGEVLASLKDQSKQQRPMWDS